MGTRHLIAVQLDEQYRIAQYGQWDGNPQNQGEGVLGFLTSGYSVDRFKRKLRTTEWATKDWLHSLGEDWHKTHLYLSRDTGSDILYWVYKAPEGIKLKNDINFAGASLFCEWAYVIDYDKNTFEMFRGFNKTPLATTERFYGYVGDDGDQFNGYEPVRLMASWPLDALPTQAQLERAGRTDEEQAEWEENQREEERQAATDAADWQSSEG